ncbi:hypothetical protein [Aureimonas altamirensis]|uniref:hypothetical protein n=1 Tax=Aureimonas altamirensis TaxID=370622 RepID=UPI002556A2C1|nr:hypothetical protein [Aureimonas altamirensis]
MFGRTNGSSPVLSDIVGGTGGFVVVGEWSNNYFGYSASAAGDVRKTWSGWQAKLRIIFLIK